VDVDLTEQIGVVAASLAGSSAESASATYRDNLRFLVSTATALGQDPSLIDLTDAVRIAASNLAACDDEESSRTYRANLQFLVDVIDGLPAPTTTAPAHGAASLTGPGDDLLTTTQAAGILDVSRATLMRLIEAGEIEHVMVGSHHRIPVYSVRSYKRARLVSREFIGEPRTAPDRTIRFGDDAGAVR
jgi:excisionase family DNA binding protein